MAKALGGSSNEEIWDLKALPTGYILAGYTQSDNGDVSGYHGTTDAWIIMLDLNGNLQWQKCLGGSGGETGASVAVSADNQHYFIAGSANSMNGDVMATAGGNDVWVIKLNDQGQILAQQTFGGNGTDMAYSIVAANATEYVVTGYTASQSGIFSINKGAEDIWVFKCKLPL